MCNFGVTVLPLRQEDGCIAGGFFVEWRWLSYWEVEGKGLRGSLLETVVAVGAVKDGHGFFPSLDATL